MLILTILLSIAFAAGFTLLPARVQHRKPARADGYAGAGVTALVWLWAVCIWSRPGLTVDFDGFRLAAILAMQGLSCGIVCGFRLRGALPQKLRTPAAVVLLLAASLGAEVFIGNLSWLATSRYTPVDLRPYLTNDPNPAAPLTLQGDSTVLEFADLGFEVYNLQLDGLVSLADGDTPEQKNVLLQLYVAATDEASSASRQSWGWEAAPASGRSLVRSLDLSGRADTLTLTVTGYKGEYRSYPLNAQLTTVCANVRRPLDFSLLRFAAVFALALADFALRPASVLWRDSYCGHEKKYRPAMLAAGLALCAAAFLAPFGDRFNAGVATGFYNTPDWSGTSRIDFTMHINDWASNASAQYGALAHSLLNGRLDLEKDPPAAMAALQNPYDTAARQEAAPDALWDVAYYNGRYYVYFGIVPCLLFQLPFEALTGVQDLPPSLPMILLAWLYIAAVFGFVRQAVRRWFPDASAAACLLAAVGAASGTQLWYLLHRPSVYEYAILCGAVFVLWALWQWLLAANTPLQKRGRVLFHLTLGSLCMALVAGCRPQMVLFAVLALPILWLRYITEKRLCTRQGAGECIAFLLPVVLVAAGLMWYNAARFGSVFDFGANYNLTSNDMTRRGFAVGRIAPAVVTFLLGIPGVQTVFPYLSATKMQTNYMGLTITELYYGGAFACLPLLWGLGGLPLARRRLGRCRDLRAVFRLTAICTVVLAVLDCQMAGMLYRYQSDWLGPLLLAAALAWLLAERTLQGRGLPVLTKALRTVFPLAVLAGICYNFCVYFAAEPQLMGQNPALYENVSRLVQFWL
ncbi:MAG: hypothetical protein UE643_05580 [Gemmiger sp.]|nr:hypothetical protein [Gemmiger sp.]